MTSTIPSYDQLSIDPKYPAHTAWGLWGDDDSLGTLNLLTEEVVREASTCIKQGKVFALNWDLEKPNPPLYGRSEIKHKVMPHKSKLIYDDGYENLNTQSSTQWDGLRHISHLPSKTFYNGVSAEEIADGISERLGIHYMARRGIAGRAVLLDYARWVKEKHPDRVYDPLQRTEITVQELDQVAEAQGVTFKHGDILLVRIGWTEAYEEKGHTLADLMDLKNPISAGIKACQDTYRWIWDHHFAAVGSDCPAFEAYPPKDWLDSCHATFLGGWGMPIGEMFFLEKLAEDSADDGVYEFFFTSAPLNKHKGVASPPNAVCIK